jgi:hypothetical protein
MTTHNEMPKDNVEEMEVIMQELRDYCENNNEGYWYAFSDARKKLNQLIMDKESTAYNKGVEVGGSGTLTNYGEKDMPLVFYMSEIGLRKYLRNTFHPMLWI